MELAFLYRNGLMSQVMPDIQRKLGRITEGQLTHAENALAAVFTKLSLLLDPCPKYSAHRELVRYNVNIISQSVLTTCCTRPKNHWEEVGDEMDVVNSEAIVFQDETGRV